PSWWGFERGLPALAPFGPMVAGATRAQVAMERVRLTSGGLDVFVGPIPGHTGPLRLPAGAAMPDRAKVPLGWRVGGDVGSLPLARRGRRWQPPAVGRDRAARSSLTRTVAHRRLALRSRTSGRSSSRFARRAGGGQG